MRQRSCQKKVSIIVMMTQAHHEDSKSNGSRETSRPTLVASRRQALAFFASQFSSGGYGFVRVWMDKFGIWAL